jgi:class 3 adenylate cyclase
VLQQPSTQHRTIIVIDVEGFTDPTRRMTHLLEVQEGLYKVLEAAFGEAGIDLEECRVEDRGDGALILIPPTITKNLLADQLPGRLIAGLLRYNAIHNDESKVKLRVGLHAGEVRINARGAVSPAINLAFRILEAGAAKSALAESSGVLALIASTYFFEEVIAEDVGLAPENYRQIPVSVKKTKTKAWLWLPGATTPLVVTPAVQTTVQSTENDETPLAVFADTNLDQLRSIVADLDVPHLEILVRRATDSVIPLPVAPTRGTFSSICPTATQGRTGFHRTLPFLIFLPMSWAAISVSGLPNG